jgi:hypothetical protein
MLRVVKDGRAVVRHILVVTSTDSPRYTRLLVPTFTLKATIDRLRTLKHRTRRIVEMGEAWTPLLVNPPLESFLDDFCVVLTSSTQLVPRLGVIWCSAKPRTRYRRWLIIYSLNKSSPRRRSHASTTEFEIRIAVKAFC